MVTGYTSEAAGKASGLEPGDEIAAIDGVPVSKLVAEWTPFYADSNEAARMRDMARTLTNGNCGPVRIDVRRNGAVVSVAATRLPSAQAGLPAATHDLSGPTFRLLSEDIAYLKLSSVKVADSALHRASEGDARPDRGHSNYPSEFVVFALGSLLVRQPTAFAAFSVGDLSNPGAFRIGPMEMLKPAEPHYDGKVVILVDEVSQSNAEYTTMALRAAPNAIIVGSTTAGADGDVSGDSPAWRVARHDHRTGRFLSRRCADAASRILADVEVRPTVAGIRAGRDEVLKAAIRQIVPELPSSEIEKLAESH